MTVCLTVAIYFGIGTYFTLVDNKSWAFGFSFVFRSDPEGFTYQVESVNAAIS